MSLDEYKGKVVLVVNTASKCGFTKQYDGLQELYDTYQNKGFVVLAVPSNNFKQELKSNDSVQEFCEVNFSLTLPMTEITSVRGEDAHPFYRWLNQEHGFTPKWNFYKVLLDKEGNFVGGYTSVTKPMSSSLVGEIESLLQG